ncbi:V4R domain-containing protein [Neobacillus sp. D3-1R]|uniref:V4R domain-containing protein n=1 Tax=Neobacillus sp. D3-1R TaxID=3445778 RepID=UPI003FA0B57A
MENFTFEDMKKIKREVLGDHVPLELFRAIRLIGMYQGLPMQGKSTTITVGRKIGESLPVESMEDVLDLFTQLKIGIPHIIYEDENELHIAVDDCFCEGLPSQGGKMVCDLEGAILEGALTKVWNRKISIRETKCNVNGDDYCEYKVSKL